MIARVVVSLVLVFSVLPSYTHGEYMQFSNNLAANRLSNKQMHATKCYCGARIYFRYCMMCNDAI